ncbi:MAG: APC family permease [Candidatus Aenigmarchaeota archaeon]|nr:APC family permease [Candidatus Aenigmarchaeota archaeon]
MRKIRLIRGLGYLEAVMLGIGFIVGSGIFIMPLLAGREAGTLSLVSWVIGGIFSILTGLCFAELAAKVPEAGGPYAYVHHAFGNTAGFMTGWIFWVYYWVTIAGETLAIALYLEVLFPQLSHLMRVMISLIITVVLTIINIRGVKSGGKIEDVFTIGKMIPLIIFVILGLFFVKFSNFQPYVPEGKTIVSAIGSSTILILWAYLGVEIITVPEKEIKSAKKNIRKAIMVSILVTNSLYLLIAFVTLGVMSWTKYGPFSTLVDVSKIFMSSTGTIILLIGGLISIIGALNAVILASARIAMAISADNLFPSFLKHVNKKYKTPDYALILQTILAVIIIFAVPDFKLVASLSILLVLVTYLFSCFAVLRLIKKFKGEMFVLESKVIPIISIIACILFMTQISIFVWEMFVVFVIVGWVVYLFRRNKIKPTPPPFKI